MMLRAEFSTGCDEETGSIAYNTPFGDLR
jgi:hypothetical protein